jgi:hypothetical protein
MIESMRLPEVPELPREPALGRLEPPTVFVRPTWEYKHLVRAPDLPLRDEAELNALGRDGWELVGVYAEAGGAHFYFKRAVS